MDEGGVNFAVKRAIAESVDPIEAIQIATLNTAQLYNRPFGHVDHGALADLMLLDDLESWDIAHDVDGRRADGDHFVEADSQAVSATRLTIGVLSVGHSRPFGGHTTSSSSAAAVLLRHSNGCHRLLDRLADVRFE